MNRHWAVKLDDVAEINPRAPKHIADDDEVAFVPMSAVSEDGSLGEHGTRPYTEVKKGYTYFERGDVLVAKITPCFENGKAALVDNLVEPIGFGSTEFHVLRPGPDLDGRYLFYMLWNEKFRAVATGGMTGSAGQKRVPAELLRRTEIRLPTLDEQRRIAAILDKADALRQKRKRVIALLDSLTQSTFSEMFGNSLADLPHEKLGTLTADARIGLVRSASEFGPQFSIPYVRMDAIGRDGLLNMEGVQRTDASEKEIQTYELRAGDFLFNTRNSRELVGKGAVFYGEPGAVYNNNLLRMRFDGNLIPEYLAAYFRTDHGRQALEERKSGTTSVFAIYQKALEALSIPIAPITHQREFAARVRRTLNLRVSLKRQEAAAVSLFSSLQHRAFSGQL